MKEEIIKNRCPRCGNYAILLKGQDMCWDCYIAEDRFEPKGEE